MEPIVTHVSDLPPAPRGFDSLLCNSAQFETSWPQESTAVVAAHGEIDASNSIKFVEYALRQPGSTQRLILDFTGVKFFATAGFTALHTLNVQCVREQIRWTLVPSPAVDRILRICDPDSALPIAADVDTALTAVHEDPPRLLQLVPESR